MGPYRTAAPMMVKPALPSRWKRLLCWIGLHEGPFTIGQHWIECDTCRRVVSD